MVFHPNSHVGEAVQLDWYELQMACSVGVSRQIEAFRRNLQPKLGYWSWHSHIEGAAAELAAAKVLGLYWSGSVNTFTAADIGEDIQVRLRKPASEFEPCLIVRPEDNPEHVYVLVVGESPNFRVVGWEYGEACKKPEFLKTYGNNSRPAYFVPIPSLRPLSELE